MRDAGRPTHLKLCSPPRSIGASKARSQVEQRIRPVGRASLMAATTTRPRRLIPALDNATRPPLAHKQPRHTHKRTTRQRTKATGRRRRRRRGRQWPGKQAPGGRPAGGRATRERRLRGESGARCVWPEQTSASLTRRRRLFGAARPFWPRHAGSMPRRRRRRRLFAGRRVIHGRPFVMVRATIHHARGAARRRLPVAIASGRRAARQWREAISNKLRKKKTKTK